MLMLMYFVDVCCDNSFDVGFHVDVNVVVDVGVGVRDVGVDVGYVIGFGRVVDVDVHVYVHCLCVSFVLVFVLRLMFMFMLILMLVLMLMGTFILMPFVILFVVRVEVDFIDVAIDIQFDVYVGIRVVSHLMLMVVDVQIAFGVC